jgi:hypothetical protein
MMRRLVLTILLLAVVITASGQEPTVTLRGASYTLQPHPRAFFNSALNTRIAYSSGLAPKAVNTNPAWEALVSKAAALYSAYPPTNPNYSAEYMDGSYAAIYAQVWYSDNSQTQYLTAAENLLNNIQSHVPIVCNELAMECVNGSNGYWLGSYGPPYYMVNWIYAYELIRSQLTTAQQQAFADKFLNDLSVWGGIDGSPSTSCTNPTAAGSINVSISASGVVTASSPYFGSGYQVQVGDWIYPSTEDSGNDGLPAGSTVVSITDNEHATIESDQWANLSGYSGTLLTRRGAWNAGDCGWVWLAKHDWYAPWSIIGNASLYPSPNDGYGGYGGYFGQVGSDNHVIAQTYGIMTVLLSVADDDVNFSTRDSVELTALYNGWYTNTYLAQNEYTYTGFTPTGSVYGIWRASSFVPLTGFTLMNSVVSPPPLLNGVWAKNFAHHFYLSTFPSCPLQEMEWGQTFGVATAPNNLMVDVPGLPALVSMFNTDPEGQYLNWWMQNRWSTCYAPQGNTPGTHLMWNAAQLGAGSTYQNYFYLYSDPAYTANPNLPTGSVDNMSDDGPSGLPMAGMMSRTGYTSMTDSLVMFYALGFNAPDDHTDPNGGFMPAEYRIYRGSFLLADDSSTQSYNSGGPFSMAMEIGGDSNIVPIATKPFIDKMPLGHADVNYVYAMTDSTLSYVSGANASGVYRHLVHFKKSGTQDFVVVYDSVTSTAGNSKQTYLHYPQTAYTGGSCPTSTGSTSFSGTSVTSSFSGTASISYSDKTQLLSSILSPSSAAPVYAYVQNPNGTYTGGNGCTFRVSLCAATAGATTTCNASNTAAEFAVVHEPITGSGNTMPSTEMLATIDGSHRGVEIDGSSPKVAVFPIANTTYTSASFTTAHPGTAQYMIAGLAPGTYSVMVNGSTVASGLTVAANDDTLYFESTAGAVAANQTGLTDYTLSTGTAGTGSGTVSGCAGSYTSGTAYVCSATASGSSTFVSWSSMCGGTASGTSYSGNMPAADCSVTATFSGSSPTLTSITVAPSTASIAAGGTQQYAAQCNYSDSSHTNCTSSATWTSSTIAATINSSGLATGATAGGTYINATLSGITGTAVLSVYNTPTSSWQGIAMHGVRIH